MFDTSLKIISNRKIIVIAIIISNASAYLFSNYNKIKIKKKMRYIESLTSLEKTILIIF